MDINQKTRVPLFAVITAIPTLVGAIAWATMVYYKADAAVVAINRQAVKDRDQDKVIEKQMDLLIDIRERVIRIEEHQTRRR